MGSQLAEAGMFGLAKTAAVYGIPAAAAVGTAALAGYEALHGGVPASSSTPTPSAPRGNVGTASASSAAPAPSAPPSGGGFSAPASSAASRIDYAQAYAELQGQQQQDEAIRQASWAQANAAAARARAQREAPPPTLGV